MRFFSKAGGAISVFLVIILVPCMLVASIFVDISRMHLAKAVAESSADLALSTLMSYYDYDLSEYYGLMGSCQNIEDYYAPVGELFDAALRSQDVEDEEIRLLYQRVNRDLNLGSGEEKISDILQLENRTEGAVLSGLDGANLYNATILQRQVVEFMKYRGPVTIAQKILEMAKSGADIDQVTEGLENLKKESGVGALLESEENNTLVDNKTKFYEAEGKLLKTAFDIYWDLRAYTDAMGDNGEHMSASKLEEYAGRLETYRTAYQEIHGLLVGNLLNTEGLTEAYTRVTINLERYQDQYDKTSEEIYSRVETASTAPAAEQPTESPSMTEPSPGASSEPESSPVPAPSSESVYYIDSDKVTALTDELKTARDQFISAKNEFIQAGSDLMNTLPGSGEDDAHEIQWWVRMNAAVQSASGVNYTDQLRERADAMVRAYARLQAAKECEKGNGLSDSWKNDIDSLLNEVKSLHGQYLKADSFNDTDNYLKQVNLLERVSAANLSKVRPGGLNVSLEGQSRSPEAAVSHIQGQLSDMLATVRNYEGLLDQLLETSEGEKSPLDQLYDLAGEYASTLDAWDDSADAAGTDLAEEHKAEIDDVRNLRDKDSGSTEICLKIDRSAVSKLKTRLVNISSQYQAMEQAIEEMLYGTKKLQEIGDLETMKTCARTVVQTEEIGLTNREVISYADSSFSRLFSPASGNLVSLKAGSDTDYNPLISPVTKQVNTPELYVYLHGKFQDTSRDQVEEMKKDQDDANEQANDAEGDAKDKGRYHGEGQDIVPTESSKGNEFKFGDRLLSSLITAVDCMLSGEFDHLRDNLYVTSYIMEMFSYATYEEEGKYSLLEEDKRRELRLSEDSKAYYKTVYRGVEGSPEKRNTWLSIHTEDTYNKTLTNRLINKENNVAYLAEVEYILYGKTNADSVKAAYGDIFELRYILNLISAFENFWGRGNNTGRAINGVADAIMGATAGVIPAALTKVIVLPILTTYETCKDLDRLEAGFPVELYKGADDWWCSLKADQDTKSIGKLLESLSGDRNNPDRGLQYSDYLTFFVYLGLQRKDDTSRKMYLRMGDVIQANMRRATEKEDYSLMKTQVYFRSKARLKIKPLMLPLPYFQDYVDDDPTMKDEWSTFQIETIRGY